MKKLGVHQTAHEVLLELSSPAIHCSSLTSCCDTHTACWYCCTPSRGRWEGEGVYRTVNTVIVAQVIIVLIVVIVLIVAIVGVCYTCSWGCGMPLPIT